MCVSYKLEHEITHNCHADYFCLMFSHTINFAAGFYKKKLINNVAKWGDLVGVISVINTEVDLVYNKIVI